MTAYLASVGAILLVAPASAAPASANPWPPHGLYFGPGYAYDYPYDDYGPPITYPYRY
jgi:hypothetical protein